MRPYRIGPSSGRRVRACCSRRSTGSPRLGAGSQEPCAERGSSARAAFPRAARSAGVKWSAVGCEGFPTAGARSSKTWVAVSPESSPRVQLSDVRVHVLHRSAPYTPEASRSTVVTASQPPSRKWSLRLDARAPDRRAAALAVAARHLRLVEAEPRLPLFGGRPPRTLQPRATSSARDARRLIARSISGAHRGAQETPAPMLSQSERVSKTGGCRFELLPPLLRIALRAGCACASIRSRFQAPTETLHIRFNPTVALR